MDNYLSKLVDRALSRAPVIQPRRASLFAPPHYSAGLLGRPAAPSFLPPKSDNADAFSAPQRDDPSARESSDARDITTRTEATRPPAAHPRFETDETGRPASTGATRSRPPDERTTQASATPRPPHHVARPPALEAGTQPRAEEFEVGTVESRVTAQARAAADTERDRARLATVRPLANRDAELAASARAAEAKLSELRTGLTRDEQAARQFEHDLAHARAELNRRDAAGRARSSAEARADTTEFAARAQQPRHRRRAEESAAHTPRAQEQVAPLRPRIVREPAPLSPRRAAEAASPPAPEPTVQVTIGRIEVRATPGAPAARGAPAPAPRLSLEEYLHRRNGGGR